MEPLNEHQALDSQVAEGPVGKLLSKIETTMTAVAGISLVALCAYIVSGVVLRALSLGQSPDVNIIVGELMVVAICFPLATVAAEKSFIAVEIFTEWVAPKGQHRLAILALIVGLIAAIATCYSAWFTLRDAIRTDNYYIGLMQWPEWPGRVALFVAYLFFSVRLIHLLVVAFLNAPKETPTNS